MKHSDGDHQNLAEHGDDFPEIKLFLVTLDQEMVSVDEVRK